MNAPALQADSAHDQFDQLARAIHRDSVWVLALAAQRSGVALIDRSGVIRAASTVFAEFARSQRDALVGRKIAEVTRDANLITRVAELNAQSGGALYRARPFESVRELFGGTSSIDWTLTPIAEAGTVAGALLTVQDVSARNRAIESARLREADLESLIANLPAAIYRGFPDWSVEAMPGAEALTGYSIDDINAMPNHFRDLIYPEDLERVLGEAIAIPENGEVLVQHYRIVGRDGAVIPVEDRKRLIHGDSKHRIEGLLIDVRNRHLDAGQHHESAWRLKRILQTSLDGYLLVAPDARICDANDAYVAMSGYSRDELLAMRITDVDAHESIDETAAHIERVWKQGGDRFETLHRRKDGTVFPVEVSVSTSNDSSGHLYAFVRDITSRRSSELLLETRVALGDLALSGDRDSLLQQALDRCEMLTGSSIGFFHFVDVDGKSLTLQAWSTNTLSAMCNAEGKGRHYPVGQAGIWAACVGSAKPVICNDYATTENRKGLPEGHATVQRFVSVPIVRHGRVVAVLGVGNKAEPYGVQDAFLIEQMGGFAYDGLDRIATQERIANTEATLRLAQRVAHLGSAEIDLLSGEIVWSQEIRTLLAVANGTTLDRKYFFGRIAAGYRESVAYAWEQLAKGSSFDLEHRMVAPVETREPFVWVHQRGEVVRWDGDRPIRAVITLQDVTDHKHAQEQIARLSHFDPLTTLPNRSLFNLRFRHSLEKAARRGSRVALMMLDVDLFKHVNEAMGHGVGDQLLVRIAQRLRERLRGEDLVARIGGDEFAILIEEIEEPAAAGRIATDLIAALEPPIAVSDEIELSVSASVGISIFPEDTREAEALLANADAALYLAKSQGRKTFRFYKESLTTAALDRIRLESRLQKALGKNQFLLHYQALWGGDPLRPVGAEALVRWMDPENGLVPPGKFIPVAEDSGAIVPLGRWVLLEACRQMRAWLEEGRNLETMAVNVSARQFALSDVVADVQAALAAAGLDPRYLEIEITEGVLLEGDDRINTTLNGLNDMGVRIAIDDFGTGYSSLMYLKRYPVDKLKIDQSFVRDLPGDSGDAEIVGAIVAMGRALKLTVLAEGVETDEQYAFLETLGCDVYQGYRFAKPVVPDEFPWVWQPLGDPLHHLILNAAADPRPPASTAVGQGER